MKSNLFHGTPKAATASFQLMPLHCNKCKDIKHAGKMSSDNNSSQVNKHQMRNPSQTFLCQEITHFQYFKTKTPKHRTKHREKKQLLGFWMFCESLCLIVFYTQANKVCVFTTMPPQQITGKNSKASVTKDALASIQFQTTSEYDGANVTTCFQKNKQTKKKH